MPASLRIRPHSGVRIYANILFEFVHDRTTALVVKSNYNNCFDIAEMMPSLSGSVHYEICTESVMDLHRRP